MEWKTETDQRGLDAVAFSIMCQVIGAFAFKNTAYETFIPSVASYNVQGMIRVDPFFDGTTR